MTMPLKPFLLLTSMPAMGHYAPILAIARSLVRCGYDVTFLTGPTFQKSTEEVGAKFVALSGPLRDLGSPEVIKNIIARRPPGDIATQLAFDMTEVFVKTIPYAYASIQDILRDFRAKDPSRPVIILNECMFLASLPLKLGAEGLRPDAVIGIGIIPLALSSVDLPPFGPGLPPASTPEERETYAAMRKHAQNVIMGGPQAEFQRVLGTLGAPSSSRFFLDEVVLAPDRFLQMCVPSVEYTRSDLPPNVRFIGGLPRGESYRGEDVQQPAWWNSVFTGPDRGQKRIVAVSQGTIHFDYTHLVMPTITALAGSEDVVVVAALGLRGATLPSDFAVPKNAYVADYIPFDDLLEHVNVFVTNGGYGGFQHAVSHGVPLIVAGETEDKPEVAARAEWAGVGVNLRTGKPSADQVGTAIREVLENPKYKARAMEVKSQVESYDPLALVAENIEELAASAKKLKELD